ncbi:hypothetical protein LCGC14_1081210 [marine sediment metagenome]|uniref:Uncharacterized protein n=1 Tax=marine sediment metagenome TaxID=412755 RepID=A0A0F9QL10_9ZZZZ
MKNKILEEIKVFALNKLNKEYGFCGVADCDDFAMLNSTDNKGHDILIEIKLKKDK